jgi:transposase InsO family protein
MPWRSVNVLDQRVEFAVRAKKGESMVGLCREFEISRPTGYLWSKRFETDGVLGCEELSRRPQSSPSQTAEAVERAVVEERKLRPDWGARKLRVVLQNRDIHLPVPTIHRILVRHDLIRADNQHRPAVRRFEREQPNELWQMDFKGPPGWNRTTGPLSVLDDHSRFALALADHGTTKADPVRDRLQQVFSDSGVPQEMLLDHGTPWWNMRSGTGWTWLTVWLMKQNIRLLFCAFRHPQTQGKIERFHGSLQRAVRERLPGPVEHVEQAWLDTFRHEYNHLRPHEALGMTPPAKHWHKSEKAYDRNPSWDYGEGAEVQRLTGNGQLWFNHRHWDIGWALAGESIALVRGENRVVVYYRRTIVRELDLKTGRSLTITGEGPGHGRKARKEGS